MKIKQALFTAGYSSFFFDDQHAIKGGAPHDGFIYTGAPQTQGFQHIRQAGECISILLILDDGQVALGDCAAVQYSGAGGRDPLFLAQEFIPFLEKHLRPRLEGLSVSRFLDNARFFDGLSIESKRLHTAIRYGISQALLSATALARKITRTEVLLEEYALPCVMAPIPLFAQSGDDRYTAVDKMLLKKVDALPHALINNVNDKLGLQGEKLMDYVSWLVRRIETLRSSPDYQPILHIDVYGTIGLIFNQDPVRIVDYLMRLEALAAPFNLYIEGPVDAGGQATQIEALARLTEGLRTRGSRVKIVADEWCNTYEDVVAFTNAQCCHMVQIKTPDLGSIHHIVEAVLYCQQHDMEAYQGGTCNETNISAESCVHVALAARPMRMLVKPGMGFDEGMNIVHNEMYRTLALLKARKG